MKKIASGYRLVFGYLGLFLILTGLICILPLTILFAFPNESAAAPHFYIPGLASIVLGIGLSSLIWRREKTNLGKHQDKVLLVLIWVLAILICSIPFICSGEMNFTEAVFESTSGYAASGLTRFNFRAFEAKGYLHVYTFYRSLLAFFGGVGLVLVVTSVISDRYGFRLYIAEGHNDKLIPNFTKSAKLILGIYVLYIALGAGAYMIAGMDWFDSINHSISALATGGFSTREGGLLECSGNQTAIQIISCVLMIFGGTNFLIHFFLITGKFKRVVKDIEIRCFGICCLIFIPLFVISCMTCGENLSFGESIRYGTFTFISSITTTGFTNVSNVVVCGKATLFLVVIMCIIGCGMGSTAGGIKQYRLAIAVKSLYWTYKYRAGSKRLIHPKQFYRCGEVKHIGEEEINESFAFIVLYIIILFFGSLLLMFFSREFTLGECLFEFANAISSTGLTCGLTASSTIPAMWIMIIGMLAGRLEFLPIFFAFKRINRDIFRKETY